MKSTAHLLPLFLPVALSLQGMAYAQDAGAPFADASVGEWPDAIPVDNAVRDVVDDRDLRVHKVAANQRCCGEREDREVPSANDRQHGLSLFLSRYGKHSAFCVRWS